MLDVWVGSFLSSFCSAAVNLSTAWQFHRVRSNPHKPASHHQHVSPVTTPRLPNSASRLTSVGNKNTAVPVRGKESKSFCFVFLGGGLYIFFFFVHLAMTDALEFLLRSLRIFTFLGAEFTRSVLPRPSCQHICQVLPSEAAQGGYHWRQKGKPGREKCICIFHLQPGGFALQSKKNKKKFACHLRFLKS